MRGVDEFPVSHNARLTAASRSFTLAERAWSRVGSLEAVNRTDSP
jgi:hypothetical protein